MAGVDVSIVLTLHSEARYLRRTLASLSEAAAFAQTQGITVELVAVLDRADAATVAAFGAADCSAFHCVRPIAVNNGSLGPSRNEGVQAASGKYINIADGDDLVGYTKIAHAFAAAERLEDRCILMPEFIFGFGARYYTVQYFSQDSLFVPSMVKYPLYSSPIFAPRSLFVESPYADVRLTSGYAYEDWHFNCNAMASGWVFVAVEGTVMFYRQRQGSLRDASDTNSSRQILPSPLFQPTTLLHTFGNAATRPHRASQSQPHSPRGTTVLQNPIYREQVRRANAIDPAVELGRYSECLGHFTNIPDPVPGLAYLRACEIVGGRDFDAVWLLPFESSAAENDLAARTLSHFADCSPHARVLVLLDEPALKPCTEALPTTAIVVDLALLHPHLPQADRELIAFKLLQSCAASASIYCGPSDFSRSFFARFGALLQDHHVTCYRPSDHRDADGFIDPVPFEFIAENCDVIHRIVTFDRQVMEADRLRLPMLRGRQQCIQPRTTKDEMADLRIAKSRVDCQLAEYRRRVLEQARASQAELERIHAELTQARVEERLARIERQHWLAFRQSRTYRLMQLYARLYTIPIAGPILRRLRRLAGRTLHALRMR